MKPAWRKKAFTPKEEAIYRDIQRRRDELFARWTFKHETDEEYKKQHRALILELWEKLAEKDKTITFAWGE